jgi:hypothetical protein
MNIPVYLKKYTQSIDHLHDFKHNDWFKELTWKGQLLFNGDNFFRIYFEGVKYEDGFITGKEGYPLRIYAESHMFGEKILLFDEQIHGYTPLLIETINFLNCTDEKQLYLDRENDSLFEIFIWTNSSVDFLDEFQFDKNNNIKLLNGEIVDLKFLISNAFDAFGIILRNKKGEYITLTEIELS